MRRIVVVANQTIGGEHLAELLRSRAAAGPVEITLLVPATHRTAFVVAMAEAFAVQGGIEPPTPAPGEDPDADGRLAAGLEWLAGLGFTATGLVAEHDPVRAVRDFLADHTCDEIVVSTLPSGLSRWLHQDLPHRLEHGTGLPVTVITPPHPAG